MGNGRSGMKETLTRRIDGKWSETLTKNHDTGKFAAFNNKGAAVFGKGESATLYSPKIDGKRQNQGIIELIGVLAKALLK